MGSRKLPSTVRSVMSKPVITVGPECSLREAAELMTKKRVGSLVVTREGTPVGVVTERDVLEKVVAKGLNATKVHMKEIMSTPLITVKSDVSIVDAIRMMQKERIRRLLVMEKGKLDGIVTQRDLPRALAFHVVISFRPLLETSEEVDG